MGCAHHLSFIASIRLSARRTSTPSPPPSSPSWHFNKLPPKNPSSPTLPTSPRPTWPSPSRRCAATFVFWPSDLLEGRGPGSRGDELAQHYIAAQFESLGLKPAAPGGGWFQPVPLVGVTAHVPATLKFRHAAKSLELKRHDDYVFASGKAQAKVAIDNAEIVFVGYGIQAPEYQWDDFKGVDLRGKILLMMNNDPADDPELFAGKRRLYYGRWDYKYASAARQGAAGAIIIHTTPSAGYPFQVVQTSWSGEEFELERNSRAAAGNAGLADRGRLAADRVAGRPRSRQAPRRCRAARLQARAAGHPALGGILLRRSQESKRATSWASCPAAIRRWPASRRLHGPPRSPRAGRRAKCRGRQHLQRRRRQRLWNRRPAGDRAGVCVAAEAAGPLDPVCGRRRRRAGPARLAVSGRASADPSRKPGRGHQHRRRQHHRPDARRQRHRPGKSNLDELVDGIARWQNRVVTPDQFPDRGYYYRSDQFSLAKVGVPGVYLHSGINVIGKPEGWGKQQIEEWTETKYHQPSDEYRTTWDLRGAVEDVRLLYYVGLQAPSSRTAAMERR